MPISIANIFVLLHSNYRAKDQHFFGKKNDKTHLTERKNRSMIASSSMSRTKSFNTSALTGFYTKENT